MSSLVERLRVRSERRPLYTLDESDDDLPPRGGAGKGKDRQNDALAERIEREDAKEDACQRCGKNDNLASCSTCTYAFHRKCLVPCLNITPDKWSCPECVSPLTELTPLSPSLAAGSSAALPSALPSPSCRLRRRRLRVPASVAPTRQAQMARVAAVLVALFAVAVAATAQAPGAAPAASPKMAPLPPPPRARAPVANSPMASPPAPPIETPASAPSAGVPASSPLGARAALPPSGMVLPPAAAPTAAGAASVSAAASLVAIAGALVAAVVF